MMNQDKVRNAADADEVKEAKKKEKFGRDLELADLKFLLSTEQGRRFLWRYLSICGVYTNSFTGNSTTFFNEGKRLIGTTLLTEIVAADPDSYLKMIKQHNGEL